ncbi:hypothetical protein MIT9_P2157 [Methylomarinovum caldicuralii]|uniref:Uncharacterized protein n=1 Tax=Methylomarinovum caldicuralii TaxID=438856 RepID=A0AAU9BV27_9GAMM|nr:TonB-dependent receptor [Methylomarinovum caldicuralii]BCX82571.1 hypothetical protein MIT9_P2157 [Methylomarinovum caldicuralii]
MKFVRKWLPILIVAWGAVPVSAWEVPGADGLQVHGFLSQGFTWTSGNRWYGRSEDGSLDFLEAGLNVSYRPTASLMLAAQGLYRRAGRVDPNQLRLDYALADWTFWSRSVGRAGLLLGRVKNPFGLYSETRDVAFTRPTIFLPQSIYFDRTRNLGLASDGVQFYGERYSDWGDWFLRLGLGWPNGVGDKEFERLTLGGDRAGDFDPHLSYIGRLSYEYQGGLVRLAVTGAIVNDRYQPGRDDFFRAGEPRLKPLIFSAQYHGERLSLTGEYALRFLDIHGFGRHLPDTEITGESYYLQGSYRVLPKLEAVLRYDVYFADRDDTSGRRYARLTGRPRHARFARDWTVGLRWDVTPWWMLRAEWHKVDGTGWLAASENDMQGRQRRWHLFALLTSFRF